MSGIPSTTLAGDATTRIGFGCGRLVGGAGMKSSRAIVDTALALGIRHFDTAPSYGLGTSEDVLGAALAGQSDVTIATKVGQSRPGSPGLRTLARQVLRPLLSLAPGVKARLARHAGGGAAVGQFDPAQIRASLEDSLRRLRRDRVAGLLLHEMPQGMLRDDTAATMQACVTDGLAQAVGSGTGGGIAALAAFGTISQYSWSPSAPASQGGDHILHGVLRHFPRPDALSDRQAQAMRQLGRDPAAPDAWVGLSLTAALRARPGAILLLSSMHAERLRQAVDAIDWSMAQDGTDENLHLMLDILKGMPRPDIATETVDET